MVSKPAQASRKTANASGPVKAVQTRAQCAGAERLRKCRCHSANYPAKHDYPLNCHDQYALALPARAFALWPQSVKARPNLEALRASHPETVRWCRNCHLRPGRPWPWSPKALHAGPGKPSAVGRDHPLGGFYATWRGRAHGLQSAFC